MQFAFAFDDDEVPRDVAGEASVRFWDDAPGTATGERTRITWTGPNGHSVVVPGRLLGQDLMALVDALSWSAGTDELTLGDLWMRWWM